MHWMNWKVCTYFYSHSETQLWNIYKISSILLYSEKKLSVYIDSSLAVCEKKSIINFSLSIFKVKTQHKHVLISSVVHHPKSQLYIAADKTVVIKDIVVAYQIWYGLALAVYEQRALSSWYYPQTRMTESFRFSLHYLLHSSIYAV